MIASKQAVNVNMTWFSKNTPKPGRNFMLLTACFNGVKAKSIFFKKNIRLPASMESTPLSDPPKMGSITPNPSCPKRGIVIYIYPKQFPLLRRG